MILPRISKTAMNTRRRKKRDEGEKRREILNRPMERGEKVYAGNEFFLSREQILLCKSGQCRVPPGGIRPI